MRSSEHSLNLLTTQQPSLRGETREFRLASKAGKFISVRLNRAVKRTVGLMPMPASQS
jgi:hypothetical protein